MTFGRFLFNKIARQQGLFLCTAEGLMEPLGKRLAAGEPSAFAELYDLCAARCHHYLTVRLAAREAADEVLQEAFVRLVRRRQRLADVENLLAYVFAVVRNEANTQAGRRLRSRERRAELSAAALCPQ